MRRLGATLFVLLVAVAAPIDARARDTYKLDLGGYLVFSGQTGSGSSREGPRRAAGRVFVTATWNAHPRYTVAAPLTDGAGRYRFVFKPTRRGTYRLRVVTPDKAVRDYQVFVT
jgi:hypothetical protein